MQTGTVSPRRRFPPWALGALVVGLVLACYWPALRGGLVFDDLAHMTRPDLQSWSGLARIWFERGATAQYYPLFNTALWIEHRCWGDAVLGYHLVNVLLHGAAACLVVAVTRRMLDGKRAQPFDGLGTLSEPNGRDCAPTGTGERASSPSDDSNTAAAWLAGLVFALHPAGVESVAWISEQKNTLSAVFFLGAALAYLGFDRDRRHGRYWLALGLFLLALLTKTVTATLPPTLLVIFWWQRGRLDWRRDVLPLVPWLVLGTVAGLYTAWFERQVAGARGAEFALPLTVRGLVAGRAIWFYLRTLLWPAHLMFINPRWSVDPGAVSQYAFPLAAAAVVLVLGLAARRARGPGAAIAAGSLAGYLIFVGSLFPALGFFNLYWFTYSFVADHFQYLACLGIIVPAAAGLARAAASLRRSLRPGVRRLPPAAAGLLLLALGLLTWRQSGNYRDGVTLYRATLALNPDCWVAHNDLAWELAKSPAGVPEAIIHYEAALRLKPDCAEAHDNYASLLASLPGRAADAAGHFEQALRLRPNFLETRVNYANLLATMPGGLPRAVAQYREALRYAPDFAEVHYSLANALTQIPGRAAEALAQYELALHLKPDFAQAHVNLANELAKLPGRMPEALAHYEAALRINPNLAVAHYNLAVQLSSLRGREEEARRHYLEALRLRPDYARAHNDLGVLYARQGRFDEARKEWEQAAAQDPNYEDPRRNLDLLRRRQQRQARPD